jgi:CBS domain-containing protein
MAGRAAVPVMEVVMRVVDVMTPNPRVVEPDEPLLFAAEAMRDLDVGFVPVVDSRSTMKPVGVITDRDIAVRHVAAAHHRDCPARDVMTSGRLVTVRPRDSVEDVIHALNCAAVRRALVIDGDGRLVGVVATADLLRAGAAIGHERVESLLESLAQPTVLQR